MTDETDDLLFHTHILTTPDLLIYITYFQNRVVNIVSVPVLYKPTITPPAA